ncbi:unnamed protein product [Dicrocoelium dendriticum]|nr:unnamed protein product [Dicrocoelium dendriticum]
MPFNYCFAVTCRLTHPTGITSISTAPLTGPPRRLISPRIASQPSPSGPSPAGPPPTSPIHPLPRPPPPSPACRPPLRPSPSHPKIGPPLPTFVLPAMPRVDSAPHAGPHRCWAVTVTTSTLSVPPTTIRSLVVVWSPTQQPPGAPWDSDHPGGLPHPPSSPRFAEASVLNPPRAAPPKHTRIPTCITDLHTPRFLCGGGEVGGRGVASLKHPDVQTTPLR